MSRIDALRNAKSLADLSDVLGYTPKGLAFIVYRLPTSSKYRAFEIPKRSGGRRTIHAPADSLKLLQRKLADLLQDCVDEIAVKRNRVDRIAHGFKRKRSILTNASRHRRRRWVLNVDLEDFFPSINFGRVRGYFLKNRDFELHADVATLIAQIACHDNALPQGSPCSPVISNLLAHVLDIQLAKLAWRTCCTYTRYADDLTFSTNEKAFAPEVAVLSSATGAKPHDWIPGKSLEKIIARAGFRLNRAKTNMMYRASRQDVTGLVVNEKLSIRRQYRHEARAMVHRLVTTGTFEIVGLTKKAGQSALAARVGTTSELHGMLGFIDTVLANNPRPSPAPKAMSSAQRVYREFLLYKDFYAAQSPVVLCEGETDNVYLTHAIRALRDEFPSLAKSVSNEICLKVRLYKYRHARAASLLGLKDGGSSALCAFIGAYKKETSHFRAPVSANPVLILFDNDQGAKDIRGAIRKASGGDLVADAAFHHITKNLYAVPTPLQQNAKESKIEDFFSLTTKATRVGGKTFDDSNSTQIEIQYGKKIFAHKVVRANAGTIDFTGFRPLLANLTAAIEHCRASSSSS